MSRSIIRRIAAITLMAFLITSVGFAPMDVSAESSPYLILNDKISYNKRVTVNWSKVTGAQRYVVYRSQPLKKLRYDSSNQKFTKVATLSGKSTSFKDRSLKYGYYYGYVVKAYKKKNGKWKKIAQDYTCAYIGIMETGWDEYQWSDVPYSTKSVEIRFQSYSSGMQPTGIILERKTKGGKYKKIATLKVSKNKMPKYVDRSVKAGTKYYYRCRPYVKYKGKTIYGKYYSTIFTRTPANQTGQYDAVIMGDETPGRTMIVRLTSNKNNGKLVFNYDELLYQKVNEDGEYEDYGIGAEITKYSTDGVTWSNYKADKITLKPGGTVYLQLDALIDSDFDTSGEFVLTTEGGVNCTYNGIGRCSTYFHFNGHDGHATVGPSLDYWH